MILHLPICELELMGQRDTEMGHMAVQRELKYERGLVCLYQILEKLM
jgi:hypothetical protein